MSTVLVVEDSSFARANLRKMLTDCHDATVVEGGSAAEAVALFREHRPDLVFLDMDLPANDALEALRSILIIDPNAKVAIATKEFKQFAIDESRALGAMYFMLKPYRETVVRVLVKAFVDDAAGVQSSADQSSATVLLVEDDRVDVAAVRRAFRLHGITNPLVVAPDGVEALRILAERKENGEARPCMILLDLNMPRMNGHQFLEELRGDPNHVASNVVVMSTSDHPADRSRADDAGVHKFLVKNELGGKMTELINVIRPHLEDVVEAS